MSKVYTVGQINGYINSLITNDFILKNISVGGEVSNCKYHASGHIYFSLKDETGSIAAVMFRSNVKNGLDFVLKNGQKVNASGRIGVYERDGRYQMYVTSIRLDGTGSLYEEYERLKQKLYEQGLFEFDIKKPIPKYPRKVGIVTSDTGAAIRDIMNIAARRNPYVQLILYPAKVQGEGAAEEIAAGIRTLDVMGLDTIIIGRGGGSIEDLWAFNEEIVARAIYEANTPIISGTGHETDNTIADYAADLRAPTPSAACELAIPDVMSVLDETDRILYQLTESMNHKLKGLRDRLSFAEHSIRLLSPENRLASQMQRLDMLDDFISGRIRQIYNNRLHELNICAARINGASPSAKLTGGYGYMEDAAGEPVRSALQVKEGDTIKISLHDGSIATKVTQTLNR